MRYFLFLLFLIPRLNAEETLTPVWVEAGPLQEVTARVVVKKATACPSISMDGKAEQPMHLRLPVPEHFQPLCEINIPGGTSRAVVGSQTLVLPVNDPSRIAVIGDTGCRIKGDRIQACNDAAEWPFLTVAERTAAAKPQLVIHVGDYLYRESPCPAGDEKQCGGSPSGDNWEAWKADFFAPASKLLAAAPWAFTRGNHESCSRSWQGWFYYLDPRPFPETCPEYSEPYLVKMGGFQLLMVDSSAANDNKVDPLQLARYTALLKPFATTQAWLVEHHPLWGLRRDRNEGKDAPLTAVMQQAYEAAGLANISLILAGHTHLFEVLSYPTGRPPQIVAGDGGTTLANKISRDLRGQKVFGTQVESGTSRQQFGLTLLERKKGYWALKLKDPSAKTLAACKIKGMAVQCKGSK